MGGKGPTYPHLQKLSVSAPRTAPTPSTGADSLTWKRMENLEAIISLSKSKGKGGKKQRSKYTDEVANCLAHDWVKARQDGPVGHGPLGDNALLR